MSWQSCQGSRVQGTPPYPMLILESQNSQVRAEHAGFLQFGMPGQKLGGEERLFPGWPLAATAAAAALVRHPLPHSNLATPP